MKNGTTIKKLYENEQSRLRELIEEWKISAKVEKSSVYYVEYNKTRDDFVLTILTQEPAMMIGRQGVLINKFKELLSKEANISRVYIKEISEKNFF